MIRKLFVIPEILSLVLSGCTKEEITPIDNPSAEEHSAGSTLQVSDEEEIQTEISEYTTRTTAQDPKGAGTYEANVEEVVLSANRFAHNAADYSYIDTTGDHGKYYVVYNLLCAYRMWDPEHPEICEEMLKAIFNSPLMPENYSNMPLVYAERYFGDTEGRDRLIDHWFIVPGSESTYYIEQPFNLIMHENANIAQHSIVSGKDVYVETVYITNPVTKEERSMNVFQDPYDGDGTSGVIPTRIFWKSNTEKQDCCQSCFFYMVELKGFEPSTFRLRTGRSPS